MTTAVIPMKPLTRAKSRLASVLPEDVRCELVRLMLCDVLAACGASPRIDGMYVVTADTSLRGLVLANGAELLPETSAAGLNAAVRTAQAAFAPGAMLYIAGDLPLITPGDISAMADYAKTGDHSAIAPSRDHMGTNAMLLSPANLIRPEFGKNSFERHLEALGGVGSQAHIIERQTLSLDIDRPEDLEALIGLSRDNTRYGFLEPYVSARPHGAAALRDQEVRRHA